MKFLFLIHTILTGFFVLEHYYHVMASLSFCLGSGLHHAAHVMKSCFFFKGACRVLW